VNLPALQKVYQQASGENCMRYRVDNAALALKKDAQTRQQIENNSSD
jgi:hypothetical protein